MCLWALLEIFASGVSEESGPANLLFPVSAPKKSLYAYTASQVEKPELFNTNPYIKHILFTMIKTKTTLSLISIMIFPPLKR